MPRPPTAASRLSHLVIAAVWTALAMLAWLAPTPAQAWTEAAVRSVQAEVVIDREARAHVTLHATVRVHGGWLEGLELAGLDPDLVLDEQRPPVATDQDGQTYTPTTRVLANGRVQFTFPGTSPRRGVLTLDLAYWTSLAHRATEPVDGERVRVRWTLPGWRSGLDGVQIDVWAPDGAVRGPRDRADTGAAVNLSTIDSERGPALRWRRAHLPRTLPWSVAVDVPASEMATVLRGPAMMALPPVPEAVAASTDHSGEWFLGLSVLLFLMVVGKLAAANWLGRGARSRARGWIPGPMVLRLSLCALAAGGMATLGEERPWVALGLGVALVALGAQRPGPASPSSQLGAWRPVDARWLAVSRRASWRRWMHPATVFDATTPLGLLHATGWLALAWVPWTEPPALRVLFSLLPLVLLASGTRRAFPAGPAETLDLLLACVGRLRTLPDGVALRPVMHVDVRGRVQDARVRTALAHRPDGLLRCDLSLAQLRHAGGWTREPCLAVVTRKGSATELALQEALPEVEPAPSRGGRRILRLVPVTTRRSLAALPRIVDAFAQCPPSAESNRGAPATQETVHELPPPKAVGL
ncbi:MAG: hypothetical protein AB8I08_04640 [Sandaracinaceae bacterium]